MQYPANPVRLRDLDKQSYIEMLQPDNVFYTYVYRNPGPYRVYMYDLEETDSNSLLRWGDSIEPGETISQSNVMLYYLNQKWIHPDPNQLVGIMAATHLWTPLSPKEIHESANRSTLESKCDCGATKHNFHTHVRGCPASH